MPHPYPSEVPAGPLFRAFLATIDPPPDRGPMGIVRIVDEELLRQRALSALWTDAATPPTLD